MSLFQAINTSASGLTAQRLRMDVISNNLANVNTTRTQSGEAYRRQMVVFQERQGQASFGSILQEAIHQYPGKGVRVMGIVKDNSPLKMVYNPEHPDANAEGYVRMPNVNTVTEMVDMISATRAYEANVTAVNSAKNMALKALEIGR
ncbi:MAG: flagellar basal body rod protein FlgC [Clostridia bacterium]|nr:flagellar basal body rod protein FlgC [Clostridia bacterium]